MNKRILHNTLFKSKSYSKNFNDILNHYEQIRNKHFSNASLQIIQKLYPKSQLFLTHSATAALEMIAILLDIEKGDEIILPSFTFVSSIVPFVSRGAKPIFIDINPKTLNIDERLIEKNITKNTKAILGMHYGGHSCNNNRIKEICKKHKLFYIEDAAMSFGLKNKENYLGSFGDFSVISFDVTKHISAIQGGLLIINNKKFIERANKIYHIGTNRTDYFNKKVPYFEWVDLGSKFQMAETNACVLYEQVLNYKTIINKRIEISKMYFKKLLPLQNKGFIKMISEKMLNTNAHLFYIIVKDKNTRNSIISYLQKNNIDAFFHYIPLHSSKMGKKLALYSSENDYTTKISETIFRLPLHTNLNAKDIDYIVKTIKQFFKN